MTNTAVNLEIDRSFCRLTQGSVNFKIDGSYSSNKFIIVSSAGRVHALYKKLETKGFLNFHPAVYRNFGNRPPSLLLRLAEYTLFIRNFEGSIGVLLRKFVGQRGHEVSYKKKSVVS